MKVFKKSDTLAWRFLGKKQKETNVDKDTVEQNPPNGAIDKMNRAIRMLRDVITLHDAQFYRDLELPKIGPAEGLEKSILEMRGVIGRLKGGAQTTEAQETNVLHKLGHTVEKVCENVTPFLKIFLAVAVQGSAV
jgi:hypothetical protein